MAWRVDVLVADWVDVARAPLQEEGNAARVLLRVAPRRVQRRGAQLARVRLLSAETHARYATAGTYSSGQDLRVYLRPLGVQDSQLLSRLTGETRIGIRVSWFALIPVLVLQTCASTKEARSGRSRSGECCSQSLFPADLATPGERGVGRMRQWLPGFYTCTEQMSAGSEVK